MTKKIAKVGALLLVVGLCSGCGGGEEIYKESRITLGTIVQLTIAHADASQAKAAAGLAFAEFERVDALLSSYREGSAVSRLNEEADRSPMKVDEEVFDLLREAGRMHDRSGGVFDVTVGPLMKLWMFDQGGAVPGKEALAEALAATGWSRVVLDEELKTVGFTVEGAAIDLGAIGKGYAVDRAAEVLRAAGIVNAIVDAGGDLRLLGRKPGKDFWRIGIRHPREASRLLLSLDLADTAVVTSGDYERFFMAGDRRYHHLLDPRTGMPASTCQSVTVIAPGTAEADAYATAAFVLGPREGLAFLRSLPQVEGIIVDAEGELHVTDRARLKL